MRAKEPCKLKRAPWYSKDASTYACIQLPQSCQKSPPYEPCNSQKRPTYRCTPQAVTNEESFAELLEELSFEAGKQTQGLPRPTLQAEPSIALSLLL